MFIKKHTLTTSLFISFLQGCVTTTQYVDINSLSQISNLNGIVYSKNNGAKLALFSPDLISEDFTSISKRTIGSCLENNCIKFSDRSIDWIKSKIQHEGADRYYPFVAKKMVLKTTQYQMEKQGVRTSRLEKSYFSIEPNFPLTEEHGQSFTANNSNPHDDWDEQTLMTGSGGNFLG